MNEELELREVTPKYVYMVIPSPYVCVYHNVLRLLADYGEEMLKDCKATCTQRNSGVIECWNMFNAAVAAYNLSNKNEDDPDKHLKLSKLLISYVTTKIKQIDRNIDESSIIFPVDENGRLEAIVTCGDKPIFRISEDNMELYEHLFNDQQDEHFFLGPEDGWTDFENRDVPRKSGLAVDLIPYYELGNDGFYHPCVDIQVELDGTRIDLRDCIYELYFDNKPVVRYESITNITPGAHTFMIVLTYRGTTVINEKVKVYENN